MKQKRMLLATLIALATAGYGMVSQAADQGYVMDGRGQPVKSGTGLCWRTGFWTPAMAIAECDPELVMPAKQEVKAAVAKQEQAPATTAFNLSADGAFQFGKAMLLPKGKAKLDKLVADLKGKNFTKLTIEGYTDRLGSQATNLKLSQRRADAVKTYLASKGVDAKKMVAEGKGSQTPVTAEGQCTGKRSPKLIACLSADRRVEIKVSGIN
jgi:OOP family OmpA-OmpF porin